MRLHALRTTALLGCVAASAVLSSDDAHAGLRFNSVGQVWQFSDGTVRGYATLGAMRASSDVEAFAECWVGMDVGGCTIRGKKAIDDTWATVSCVTTDAFQLASLRMLNSQSHISFRSDTHGGCESLFVGTDSADFPLFMEGATPAPPPPPPPPNPRTVAYDAFTADVYPIISSNCSTASCHGDWSTPLSAFVSFYDGELASSSSGPCASTPLVVHGSPGTSTLIRRLRGTECGSQMPRGAPALSNPTIMRIESWIAGL